MGVFFNLESLLQTRQTNRKAVAMLGAHLAQHVGGAVPESVLALRRVKVQQLQTAVALQRPFQVPRRIINFSDDDLPLQLEPKICLALERD